MFVSDLNTRRNKILQAAVEAYINTALPVSSQAIVQSFRPRVSTATIRNIMAELDDLGFLYQPHTSAGRIPTDKGYRYYIDSLLSLEALSLKEKDLIDEYVFQQNLAFDEFLGNNLRILSNFCGYTALAFSSYAKNKLYIERLSCILDQPEFQNIHKFHPLLRTFEEQNPLLEIMKEDLNPDGVKVHIGEENHYEEIQECSLVVSNFKVNGQSIGVLGVIGPRRMSYRKAVSTVSYMASFLEDRIVNFTI